MHRPPHFIPPPQGEGGEREARDGWGAPGKTPPPPPPLRGRADLSGEEEVQQPSEPKSIHIIIPPAPEPGEDRLLRQIQTHLASIAALQAREEPASPPAPFAFARRVATTVRLWESCGKAACRRANACRRRQAECLAPAIERDYERRRTLVTLAKIDALMRREGML